LRPNNVTTVLVQDAVGTLPDALLALASAVSRFEAIGGTSDTVVVVRSDDKAAQAFLGSVSGAKIVVSDADTYVARLAAGIDATEGDVAWIGSTSLFARPETLVWLIAAMDYEGYAMVRPDRTDATWFLARRPAMDLLHDELPGYEGAEPEIVVDRLTDAVIESGRRVAYRLEPRTAVNAPGPNHSFGLYAKIVNGNSSNIMTGAHVYSADGVVLQTWNDTDTIVVGDYSMFGDQSRILHARNTGQFLRQSDGRVVPFTPKGGHRPETATQFPVDYIASSFSSAAPQDDDAVLFSKPMIFGSDVWVGYDSLIIGASVGHGAITMAGAVVTRDVPPYTVVGGNPAEVVRARFSKPIVDKLLDIRWWDWPVEKVRREIDWFRKPIGEFVEHFAEQLPPNSEEDK
jgi:acetyltransferase-like isoleucine patch superfamily enzyme